MEQVASNVWCVTQGLKLLGVNFGCRMTVIRLNDGSLWVHSPVRLNMDLQKELENMGPVKYIIAPNSFHHLFARGFQDAFPQAKFYCVSNLPKKRPDLESPLLLDPASNFSWQKEISFELLEGSKTYEEALFFHQESQSLIITDLVFHFQNERTFYEKLFFLLVGVPTNTLVSSRLVKTLMRNRSAACEVLQKVLKWDFQRIILAHGEIKEKEAKTSLRQALKYVVK